MRYYLDIFSSRIAKMLLEDDGVIFDGVWYSSVEEALDADPACLWMQSGYELNHEES